MQHWYNRESGEVLSWPRMAGILVGDLLYPADILVAWTQEALAAIGLVPYREEGPPEGQQATAWELADDGTEAVRRAIAWEPIPEPQPAPSPVLSANEFVRRFTAEEQAAIWASANPQVVMLRNLVLSAREGIRLDDSETLGGMALLVAEELLTQARADEILA